MVAQRNTKQTHTCHAKDMHTHTTANTASLIHLLVKIHERHTKSKGEDRSTAFARLVVILYYWGPIRFMCAQPRSYLISSSL